MLVVALIPVILAFVRLRQEDCREFKASLSHVEKSGLKKTKQNKLT